MVFWFFGPPGSGKSFSAEMLSQMVNAPHVDGDDFLSGSDKRLIRQGEFTAQERIRKLQRIVLHISTLLTSHRLVIASDSLPDSGSRNFIRKEFGDQVVFIYIEVPAAIHEKRIAERKDHFFKSTHLERWMKQYWQPIDFPHETVDTHTPDTLSRDLTTVYQKYSGAVNK